MCMLAAAVQGRQGAQVQPQVRATRRQPDQVRAAPLTCSIPFALSGRESTDREIFGMAGVPEGASLGNPFGEPAIAAALAARRWGLAWLR